MIENTKLLQLITDYLPDGVILLDKYQRVQVFNQKAKEITGIIFDKYDSHKEGKIENGDIVIFADSALGTDDGGLSPKDLSLINIINSDIYENDCIIGVGVYKNDKIKPVYKYFRGTNINDDFHLETTYLGFDIEVLIENIKKQMHIYVNDFLYKISFLNSFGHMVIIDGKSGEVKFFQAKGYTIRKEAIKDILYGCKFLAKDINNENFDVIGKNIHEIFEGNELLENISLVLSSQKKFISNEFFEINKRLVLCSINIIKNNQETIGVLLNIKDASELEKLMEDRNQMLENVEKKYKNSVQLYKNINDDMFGEFIGNSYLIMQLKHLAYKASKNKFNVLITGESGTGKSLLARLIHEEGSKNSPFVEVNCNAIAPSLFESELFGYVGGAFTGALPSGHIGYFERANGGTIFLDEIGDLPLEIQVKLLYVLQNKVIYRVGSTKAIQINARIIAATNKDLEEEVMKKTFRQDLYYRINVFPIEIPPLRDHKADIYMLINKMLNKFCEKYNMPLKQLSGGALKNLIRYNWPGNVRELENIIERAIMICDSNWIFSDHITIKDYNPERISMKEQIEEAEQRILKDALIIANGNKSKAMKNLKMSKSVFYEKLKKYMIS